MDSSTETTEPNVVRTAEAAGAAETADTAYTPAVKTSAEPKAAVEDLAKATEDSTPFGTLKRRTTEAWNNIPKPTVPSELPQFPSIAAEMPTQESARETFGTLKRRTTQSFGTLSRRTTDLMKNISVPSVPDDMPQFSSISGHMPSEMPKWADFSGLASKMPWAWAQAQPTDPVLQATWERIFIPSLPRSSHSINVVAGNAYVFGGEVQPRKPVDNDMHVIVLPYSSANADYVAVKARAAPRPQPVKIPIVVEPTAEDETEGKGKDKDLSDVDLASPGQEERGEVITGSEQIADGPDPSTSLKAREPAHASPDKSSLGDVPSPRVGHATAVIGTRIFLFGGRGGSDMAALEEYGRVWVFDTKTNLWSYLDPLMPAVEPISPAFADKRQHYPAARSYHSAVGVSLPRDFSSRGKGARQSWAQWAQGDSETVGTPQNPIVGYVANNSRDEDDDGYGTFIVHGGCFTEGRTNDVWAFDVRSRVWQALPSAPGAPRGGTTLTLAGGRLWRFGGFNGEGEEGGQLDCLELGIDSFNDRSVEAEVVLSAKGEWKSIKADDLASAALETEPTGKDDSTKPLAAKAAASTHHQHPWPGHRSVAGLHTVTIGGSAGREYLLLLLGERDPSDDGHNAAGKFWDDVWAYELPRPSAAAAATSFVDSWLGRTHAAGASADEGKWFRVEMDAYDEEDVGAAKGPGPRGWFASTHMGELEERGVVLLGGVNGENNRLGDGWILRMGNEKREP